MPFFFIVLDHLPLVELELHPFDPSAGIAGGHVDVHYRVTSYPVWLGLGSD